MLKNMKIKKSLILGFGITIVVSLLIIISTLGLLFNQKNAYTSVIETEMRANELITSIRLDATVAARCVRDMALNPDDRSGNAELESYINSTLNGLDAKIKELREIYPLDDRDLDTLIQDLEVWAEQVPDIMDAIDGGRGEEAVRMILNSCSPHLNELTTYAGTLYDSLSEAQQTAIDQQERSSKISMLVIIVVMVIATAVVLMMATKLIRSIVEPTAQVHKALMGFSEGKLDIPVEFESKNELGDMCQALRTSQQVLGGVISDECRLLEEMAHGNFDVHTKDESMYVGALYSVFQSIKTINQNLSDALAQIDLSAEQVAAGSDQVSTGAQALAQSRCPPAPRHWHRVPQNRPAPWKSCPLLSRRFPRILRITPRTAKRPWSTRKARAAKSRKVQNTWKKWWRPWTRFPEPPRRSERLSPQSRILRSRPISLH